MSVNDEGGRQELAHAEALKSAMNEQWFSRQTNYPYLLYSIALLAIFIVMIWLSVWTSSYSAQDRQMLKRAQLIDAAISNYYMENLEFPERLEQVRADVSIKETWPVNPYNGQPIADSGSQFFHPGMSVGMVHYERILNDGVQGWRLHVYGKDRELICYTGAFRIDTQ